MHLYGAVTIAKGATLTVPEGQKFWMDAAASLTINSGAKLNALYQTTDSNGVTTDTVCGSYTAAFGEESIYITSNRKFALATGAVLTLAEKGYLTYADTGICIYA